ncbi:UDP-glucoronosyl and UDP-glucosyl transferase domain-containing protein [Ditylenchus destructor]|nr:UDP-glucoronosyl and UDP-glucosyl transferase domain-containing protein [Ditylenchus destructor]
MSAKTGIKHVHISPLVLRPLLINREWYRKLFTEHKTGLPKMRSCAVFVLLSTVILLILGSSANGVPKRKLKILIDNPAMAFSHMQFQGRLADVLAEAGHEVHVLMIDIDPRLKDYNASTKIHKLIRLSRPNNKADEIANMSGLQNLFLGLQHPLIGVFNFIVMFKQSMTMWKDVCREITHNRELMDQLTAERYDVAISEFYQFCSFAVFHRIGVKTKIGSLAVPLTNMAGSHFGIPMISSCTPNMMAPFIDGMNLGFFERTIKFYYDLYESNFLASSYIHMHEPIVRQAFGQDFPSLKEIARNTSLIFTNANEVFEFPKPISNKVVYIGGIVQSKLKPLAENLKSILENSKKGAVLFSFGSVTDTTKMTDKLKQSFMTAFAKFSSYDFIWKLTQTCCIYFLTAARTASSRAAHSGVPWWGIPLFGDQVFNAALMKHKGIGEYVDIKTAEDPEKITQALEKVLNDPKYRENVKTIQKKLELTPFKPEEKLVKWVEFAAEFPDLNELNLPTVEEMGALAYYSLDVIFGLVLAGVSWMELIIYKAYKYMVNHGNGNNNRMMHFNNPMYFDDSMKVYSLSSEALAEILRHFSRKQLCEKIHQVNREFYRLSLTSLVPITHVIDEVRFENPQVPSEGRTEQHNSEASGALYLSKHEYCVRIVKRVGSSTIDRLFGTQRFTEMEPPAHFIRFRQVTIQSFIGIT